ncbi:MAG: pyridoxamine 5'-phosphate oxidase family protein [Chloroflexi bacterium]|nr:pyridoxamine 5'-phosphate oxidase family protein [Chloroflexota bacterium]
MAEIEQSSMKASEPQAGRPHIPGYGIPTTIEGTLPWEHAVERLEKSRNYWIGTTGPHQEPHATPVWGVWLDGSLYFDGSPQTRRGRNLATNPAVVVHLESGSDVVILQGEAHEVKAPPHDLTKRLAAVYTRKYASDGYSPSPDGWDNGGLYRMDPHTAFAWTQFPKDATRWVFESH